MQFLKDINNVEVIEVSDIDMDDYPRFCDAWISRAKYNGVELEDDELEELNISDDDEVQAFIHKAILEEIH